MLKNIGIIVVLVALAWFLSPQEPDVGDSDVAGRARVVDGDTFWIGDTKIRLFGIDAPEATEIHGPAATQWMKAAVRNQTVSCVQKDTDRYGRMVATCWANGVNLAEELTRVGLAKAYRRFSRDYIDEEDAARSKKIGIWNTSDQSSGSLGFFADPQPILAAASKTGKCAIKGNISSNGRIFHVPGSRHYAKTKISKNRGERWFCTVAEAKAAGWRAPRG